jgi:hypothetical protein
MWNNAGAPLRAPTGLTILPSCAYGFHRYLRRVI